MTGKAVRPMFAFVLLMSALGEMQPAQQSTCAPAEASLDGFNAEARG